MYEICLDKIEDYRYELSQEEIIKSQCNTCTKDCNKSVLIYGDEEFKEELKLELLESKHKNIDDLRVGILCGHYVQFHNDLDMLSYTAAVIEIYNRKLKWNQTYLGSERILDKIRHIGKPAITEKEYQQYYNKYKDIIDEVYENNE